MHPLVSKLTARHRRLADLPILVALLELGAAAVPRATDRPERRRQLMRMLRQWERVEKAVAGFVAEGVTDAELTKEGDDEVLEPFYLQNSGWLAPGTDPEFLRHKIAILLEHITNIKHHSTPPQSYFNAKPDNTMKAPTRLEDQFNTIVTSSEPTHTALDKFLRGSLRSANALARIVDTVERSDDPPETRAMLEEAKASLLAQGFTY